MIGENQQYTQFGKVVCRFPYYFQKSQAVGLNSSAVWNKKGLQG